MNTYKHKEYTLSQTDYNYHYMIFDENGHMVCHVPYDKPITEEKAVEFIEHYILISEQIENFLDESEDEYSEI